MNPSHIILSDRLKIVQEQSSVYLSTLIPQKPASLYDPVRYIIEAGGKRLRPALTFFSSLELVGANWLPAAAAVELLHTFTLVHDDIMDNSASRRGLETVHEKYGVNSAILSGDVLIALAEQAIVDGLYSNSSKMMKEFAVAFRNVCEGQALDKEFETRNDVTIDDYFTMIGLKSAKLIELPAVLGGYSAESKDIEAIRVFGFQLGLAFQLCDDLLDLTAKKLSFGKPIGGDIVEGKRTFLYLKAEEKFESLPAQDKHLVEAIRNRKASWSDVDYVRELFIRTGIIEDTMSMIEFCTSNAKMALEGVSDQSTKSALYDFSDHLLNRDK